jgi:hypothetical protein
MKKSNLVKKPLSLSINVIRHLQTAELALVAGGLAKTMDAPCGPTAFCTAKTECNCTLLCAV